MTEHETDSAAYPPHRIVVHSGNLYVDIGNGAIHAIHDPLSDRNWRMTHTRDSTLFTGAVSVIESFDYLLSHNISMREATRRLRILRAVRRDRIINQETTND